MKVLTIPVTPFQQNCSLVICQQTKRAALVDPGGDTDVLKQAVDEAGVVIEKLLLTHGHLDHVGGTASLAEHYNVPIEGPHEADRFWIDQLPMQASMFGFPPVRSFQPDRWLQQGDEVQVGALKFQVLHCPGHTPGHVVFFQAESKLAFVGDVLFAGSIGRTDFPQGDFDTLIHSIKSVLFPLGDDVEFIPGHGPNSTLGRERRSNPFVSGQFG
ncbi:MBL fold metallo-hydrolase [Zooshikella harenae]|uniref:MBL fold metallo-hydrolase n=1 Tax=Zooshikella harenae TaxID=2827238 RepID=A0ABS5ZAL2_9GAMM|nr:MBL fold metallo-hydrolase [Zooshikella harenae]MBU2711094.1 MBL fold metallo-hydrolase [Zooshikella harenae]